VDEPRLSLLRFHRHYVVRVGDRDGGAAFADRTIWPQPDNGSIRGVSMAHRLGRVALAALVVIALPCALTAAEKTQAVVDASASSFLGAKVVAIGGSAQVTKDTGQVRVPPEPGLLVHRQPEPDFKPS